jgi:DNA adenine methylase
LALLKACRETKKSPDIRRAFDGFPMLGLSIKYSVNNAAGGGASTSRELVITNWEPVR